MVETFPPHPSVEHLPTIFRRIENRNLLIPAFQRTFVWREAQILALLESVYNGFPIGSVLLWRAENQVLKISDSPEIPFPKGPAKFPANFVLDGLQRLSTLYGVFNFGAITTNEKFNVVFGLQSLRFLYNQDRLFDEEETVPLNALFNPRSLLSVQQNLLKSPQGDELVRAALTLQSRFQEYMIPLVTLSHREVSEVVSIFERVNSTGTPLSTVDFMRAITWSSDFDLNDALTDVREGLEEANFDFSDDTIVKALGLTFDLDPLPDVMLRLREKTATELKAAVRTTKKIFREVVSFLRDELQIFGSDFVPYEGQLLTLFNIFSKSLSVSDSQKEGLRRWFFSVSLSEKLQGRSDNYVTRMIRNATAAIQHGSFPEASMPDFGLNTLLDRRMIRGKALSTAFVSLLGYSRAKSLVTGETVAAEEYLSAYDNANFWPIYEKGQIPRGDSTSEFSAKNFANVVLVPPADRHAAKTIGVKGLLDRLYQQNDERSRSILTSQLLPVRQRDQGSNPILFLVDRMTAIETSISKFLNPPS
jgi:hypothetical protein